MPSRKSDKTGLDSSQILVSQIKKLRLAAIILVAVNVAIVLVFVGLLYEQHSRLTHNPQLELQARILVIDKQSRELLKLASSSSQAFDTAYVLKRSTLDNNARQRQLCEVSIALESDIQDFIHAVQRATELTAEHLSASEWAYFATESLRPHMNASRDRQIGLRMLKRQLDDVIQSSQQTTEKTFAP